MLNRWLGAVTGNRVFATMLRPPRTGWRAGQKPGSITLEKRTMAEIPMAPGQARGALMIEPARQKETLFFHPDQVVA